MAAIHETAYPQLKSSYTEEELTRIFTPSDKEQRFARRHTRESGACICLLTLLKTFQQLGYFVKFRDLPAVIPRHISVCLGYLFEPEIPGNYDESGTRSRHTSNIRRFLNVKSIAESTATCMKQAAWQAAETREHLADIINVMIEELVRQRFELPGFTVLSREASESRFRFNEQCYTQIAGKLSAIQKAKIDAFFQPADKDEQSLWQMLKHEPAKPTSRKIKAYTEYVSWLMELRGILSIPVDLPTAKRRQFYYEACAANLTDMRRFSAAKRYSYAVILLEKKTAKALDNLAYMFIRSVQKLHHRAAEVLDEFHHQHRDKLESFLEHMLDITRAFQTQGTKEERFAAIEAVMPDPNLLIDQCHQHLAYAQNNYLLCLPRLYKSRRSLFFACLERMTLKSTSQDHRLEQALQFIMQNRESRKDWLVAEELDVSWLPEKWNKLVTGKSVKATTVEQVHRKYFELCVFTELRRQLKSGDVNIEYSEDFDDYRKHLISWEEYREQIKDYEKLTGIPVEGELFVQNLKDWLIRTAMKTDTGFPYNEYVRIENGEMVLSPTPPTKPDEQYDILDEQLKTRMQQVGILDVLTCAEKWLNLSRNFQPLSGYESRLENYPERFVSTLFCYACNFGPSETARCIPGVNRKQIAWVNSHHVTEERLDKAIVKVINTYNHFKLPKYWGTGKTASADGTKWNVYEQNLLSEYHIRYGGYGGIAYYHVSDTYIALFSHFIPCGVYEAVYILDGLIKNISEIQPDTIHGDTHAQNFAVFGLAYFLGIKLMPRIRKHKDLTLFHPDKKTRFQHIDELFGDPIDWELIKTHLPDMLRVALSIKAGKINPSNILRILNTYSRKNKLYYAFRELGRAVRTGFLLQYYDDSQLRKSINAATNKSEEFNNFAKWIAFVNDGVIRENLRHEQTKMIKYNHLVANLLILYNAHEMTTVIQKLMEEGKAVNEQAIRFLSPYRTEHINRFGSYTLNMEREVPPLHVDFPLFN